MAAADCLSSQQVVPLYTRVIEAWNRRDADGFADLFTQDCNVIGFDGSQMHGRTETASELRTIFANHPTASYVAKIRAVTPLDAHVTLLRAVVGMIAPGQHDLNPAVNAVQSVVVVLDDGVPKVALLHNTPAAFHGRPQLSEELTGELRAVMQAGDTVDPG